MLSYSKHIHNEQTLGALTCFRDNARIIIIIYKDVYIICMHSTRKHKSVYCAGYLCLWSSTESKHVCKYNLIIFYSIEKDIMSQCCLFFDVRLWEYGTYIVMVLQLVLWDTYMYLYWLYVYVHGFHVVAWNVDPMHAGAIYKRIEIFLNAFAIECEICEKKIK